MNAQPGTPQFAQLLSDKKSHLKHVPHHLMHDASKPMMWESGGLQGQQQGLGTQRGIGGGLPQQTLPAQTGLGAQGFSGGMAPGMVQQGLVQHRETPPQFLHEDRPAVLKETILPVEEESIQPVIHREVERREIHEVLQPIHERQILPAVVEEKQLPAQIRPQVGSHVTRMAPLEQSSRFVENTERHRFMNTPIVEETVKKTVIEEVQPVIHRETVAPHIIRETLPIYERVVAPDVVLKETRPMIETGGIIPPAPVLQQAPLQAPLTQPSIMQQPEMIGQKYVFDIEQKTKIVPHAQMPLQGQTQLPTTQYGGSVFRK